MEAEYIALSQSTIPTKMPVEEVLLNLGVSQQHVHTHSTIFEDNNGALTLANTFKMTPRSKHIDTKYHFFSKHIKHQSEKIVNVSTDFQKADLFTKRLTMPKFQMMHKLLMGWYNL